MILSVNSFELLDYLKESVNADLENRLKYFKYKFINKSVQDLVAFDGKKIVGMLEYQDSFEHLNFIHIEFISVDPDYQNQKISSTLLNEFIKIVKERKCGIALGSLSEDGRLKVLPKIQMLCEQNCIEIKLK